jgi:hypothetical protein
MLRKSVGDHRLQTIEFVIPKLSLLVIWSAFANHDSVVPELNSARIEIQNVDERPSDAVTANDFFALIVVRKPADLCRV